MATTLRHLGLLLLISLLAAPGPARAEGLTVATPPALRALATRLSTHGAQEGRPPFVLRTLGDSVEDGVDVVLLTDAQRLERLLPPPNAAAVLAFAADAMVLAYDAESPITAALEDGTLWFEALAERPIDFGRGDPDTSPLGLRALFVLQLAGVHYEDPDLALRVLRPGQGMPTDVLVGRLQKKTLGAGLLYRALAHQSGLRHLELPIEINLGDPERAGVYREASADVDGEVSRGAPIILFAAIPGGASRVKEAQALLALLRSEQGQKLVEEAGYVVPPGLPRVDRAAPPDAPANAKANATSPASESPSAPPSH